MIKVKDGYAKLIDTSYTGDISLVLLSNGGTIGYDVSTNTILATIGSNVASADKLKTSRKLWGLDFDGSNNISGAIIMDNSTFISMKDTGGADRVILNFDGLHRFFVGNGTSSAGYDSYIDGNNIYLRYGTSHTTGLLLNSSGNVGIGTTNPSAKLHVNGNIFATEDVTATNFISGNGVNDFSAGTVKLDTLNIPTSSESTTFGPGSDGQVLKSNGTTVYWASDKNTNSWRAIQVNGTQIAGIGTNTYALNFVSGTGITVEGAPGSSSAANVITITNTGVRSVAIGTGDNADKVAVDTNGATAYLTIPYATNASKLSNLGNHTEAASSATVPSSKFPGVLHTQGLYMTCTYNDSNTPSTFGNIINVLGTGGSLLLLGWNGSYDTGKIYYRSHRDVTTSGGWTDWEQIAYISNIPTKVSLLTNDSGFVTGGPYLPLTGGTLTGTLRMKNDVNPWISFMPSSGGNTLGAIYLMGGSSTAYSGIKFKFRQWSYNANSLTRLSYCEDYNLPETAAGLTANTTYTILTTKNASVSGGGSTWGSSITVNINGEIKTLTIPANPNTHWTTRLYAGASGTAANSAVDNPYLKVTDDNTYRNQIRFVGSGNTTVKSDAEGNIIISSTGGAALADYYWANLPISSSSSEITTPIFATATVNVQVITPKVHSNGRLTLNATSTGVDLKFNNDNTKSVILNGTAFKPFDNANGNINLGTDSARWSTIYGVNGNFSGSNAYPLVIDSSHATENGLVIRMGGTNKTWVGYTTGTGAYLYNYTGPHKIGVNDSGVGFIDSNTILHTGNYISHTVESRAWTAVTTKNAWSRIMTIGSNSNVILTICFSQNSQASAHGYFISTGWNCARIMQMMMGGYTGNCTPQVRITSTNSTTFHVEVYNTYGYNGATSISFGCRAILAYGSMSTIDTYTAGGGTVASSLTSSATVAMNFLAEASVLLRAETGNYNVSSWNPISSYTKVWGESFTVTTVSLDSGDIVYYLRKSEYVSGGSELCVVIDGDYYAGTGLYKVWHAGNDGSGSGLDADMVDGLHGSNLVRGGNIEYSPNMASWLPGYPSFVGSAYNTNSSSWWNLISVRHRNGGGDGNKYGMYIVSSLNTSDNNLVWNKQNNGNWIGERTILDSNNYTSYCAPASHSHAYYPLAGGVNMSGDNTWIGSTMGGGTDYWRIGGTGTGDNGVCQITIGDNSNDYFQIVIADYSGTNYTALLVKSGGTYAPHFYESSDQRLKENIQAILTKDNIPQIKEFDWKESGEHSYGLIAQELEEQGYSELVSTKDDGYKTVNYSAALSLIVGKLQVKILELEKEIEILKNK